MVTKRLAERAGKVIAVEIDSNLIPTLKGNLDDYPNVTIIEEDALKTKLPQTDQTIKVVGSIPYQITSPLLHRLLLTENPTITAITLIIQLDVARKITAQPPKAAYLSNLVSLWGEAKIIRKIPPNAFRPQPKVQSAIINIQKHQNTPITGKQLGEFSKFLHRGFKHPRKMLNKVFPRETLEEVGISPQARPQELTLNQWQTLHQLTIN